MKKSKKKCDINCKCRRALGVLSAGAIATSMFMGYNRLTGNVISAAEGSTTISLGGVVLFVIGLVGVLLIAREK